MSKDFDEDVLARMIRQAGGDDRPSQEHRDRLRRQALEAFDRTVAPDRPAVVPARGLSMWRWIMRHPATRYAVSAAVVVAILVSLWIGFGSQQKVAFADLIQPILDAKTATFKVTVRPQGEQPVTSDVSVWGNRLRSEMTGGMVQVIDFSAGKAIHFHPAAKIATIVEMKNLPKDRMPSNYLDRFRDMLRQADSDANATTRELGEKQVDGQRAIGFRITRSGEEWTLWINPELRLPVRVETSSSFIPDTEMTMSDFRFDVELDESMFSLTPPEGCEVRKVEQNMAPLTEEDFIASLRWSSDALDGRFPDALTLEEYANIVQAANRERKQKPKEQESSTRSVAGRGFSFPHSLPISAEAHYAGKGVSLGKKDRPIFWYRPADSDNYRVIYADLSVRDAKEAPDVPGAERIGAATKPSSQ